MAKKKAKAEQLPEENTVTTEQEQVTQTYCEQRLQLLGITPEQNVIRIYDDRVPSYSNVPYFLPKGDDIEIFYPTIYGQLSTYMDGKKEKTYSRIRFNKPENPANKYKTPKGAGTRVFVPPFIIKKFKEKIEITNLIITEGEFKAFKGGLHGFDIIGTQGIHNTRDKENKELLSTITDIVKDCKVKNLILLFDADCMEVEYRADKDLYNRPNSFYTAVKNFREASKGLNCDTYFCHIKEGYSKGLDDLLVAIKGRENEALEDILKLQYADKYFTCLNVSDNSLYKLRNHFNIHNVDQFYARYQEILQEQEFIFNRSKYQHDGKALQLLRPSEADEYIRVATSYYKATEKPNSKGFYEPHMEDWNKGEISTDFVANNRFKTIFDLIRKYDGFCNVPSHTNYEQVIGRYYNKYFPFEHKPQPGECPATLSFVEHIFGEHYEIGLDYLTIIYRFPTQVLPILCLVSKENNTGKSSFLNWLKEIYRSNMTICGNEEFQNQFNDDYASKLIIAVDESFIEKKIIKERIKSLATAKKIKLHSKGKAKQEIDFFGKIIMCSNNEDNFVQIDEEEIRWFVLKVPQIKKEDPDMIEKLMLEIPAFLNLIATREIKHERKNRAWFDPALLKTEALRAVISTTKTRLERSLTELVKDWFLTHKMAELYADPIYLTDELNKSASFRFDKPQVIDFLQKRKNMEPQITARVKMPMFDHTGEPVFFEKVCRAYRFVVDDWLTEKELIEHRKYGTQTDLPLNSATNINEVNF